MPCKSILTHWDGAKPSAPRMAAAVNLARRFDAHLTSVSFGFEPSLESYGYLGAPTALIAELGDQARARAAELREEADAYLARTGLRCDAAAVIGTHDGLARDFGLRARYADLAVLSPPYGDDVADSPSSIFEGALFEGDAAVLLCPDSYAEQVPEVIGDSVVIAWNASREALRAVRKAMPFLCEARSIDVTLIDPEIGAERDGEEPGADIALMLARYGLEVTVTRLPSAGARISDVLRGHVRDVGANLLVTGAYGHSRFREYVLGGVTREILLDLPTAVLTAH